MKKVVVFHRGYGCDSGCCGHAIRIDGEEVHNSFQFDHPYGEDPIAWAKEFAKEHLGEHGADLDWENCDVGDW